MTKRKPYSSGLVLAVDLSGAKRQRYGDRMNGHCDQQFIDELLPLCFALGRIRTKAAKGKGVRARMAALSPEGRKELARKAAQARWAKAKKKPGRPSK